MFTIGDLAEMVCNQVDITVYCENCKVIEVKDSDKYCLRCAQEICDWLFDIEMDRLAVEVQEKIAIDRGLY